MNFEMIHEMKPDMKYEITPDMTHEMKYENEI